MKLNIIQAIHCPRYEKIVTLAVCKKGSSGVSCSFYKKETVRTDGVREIMCNYGEKE